MIGYMCREKNRKVRYLDRVLVFRVWIGGVIGLLGIIKVWY